MSFTVFFMNKLGKALCQSSSLSRLSHSPHARFPILNPPAKLLQLRFFTNPVIVSLSFIYTQYTYDLYVLMPKLMNVFLLFYLVCEVNFRRVSTSGVGVL